MASDVKVKVNELEVDGQVIHWYLIFAGFLKELIRFRWHSE